MTSTTLGPAARYLEMIFQAGSSLGRSDAELLRRFADTRDEAAFRTLVERHGPMVLGTCRAVLRDEHDAEDAFQATFLILARRAGAIRDAGALGGWLHRIAYRVAVRASADTRRRLDRERRVGVSATSSVEPAGASTTELREAVHAEVERLPERLRLPVVLCDLEALPRAEAARRLGASESTVRGRLERARRRLRDRLTRRGITAPAALTALLLPPHAARAVVPLALAQSTTQLAATSGTVPATVAALVAGITRGLLLGRLTTLGAAVLTATTLGGVGFGLLGDVTDTPAEPPPPPPVAAANEPAPPPPPVTEDANPPEDTDRVVIWGRVVDPGGRPVTGAEIFLDTYALEVPPEDVTRAVSDPEGRFRFEIAKSAFSGFRNEGWRGSTVVARAEGFAPGFDVYLDPENELTLRLALDDVPIEGRLVNLEGQPVVGAMVRVEEVRAPSNGDLSAWLEDLETSGEVTNTIGRSLPRYLSRLPGIRALPVVLTDIQGRFRIDGIGRERLAEVRIEGPTIETIHVHVRTRPGETIRLPWYLGATGQGLVSLHGASFTQVASPTRPVEGIVRDRDTGAPLAGITVRGEHSLVGGRYEHISTITDSAGRYRLIGLPVGREGGVVAEPPVDLPIMGRRKALLGLPDDESLPYLRSHVSVPEEPGIGPIRLDIDLTRGVWVTGRLIDRAAGEPVAGQVEYLVFADNPHLELSPGFRSAMGGSQVTFTDAQGRFQLVAFPGPGLLAARAEEHRYALAVGAEEIGHRSEQGYLLTYPHVAIERNYHVLAEIIPGQDAESFESTLAVDPGRTLTGVALGPDGEPLAGAHVHGLSDMGYWTHEPFETAEFTLTGLRPGKGRTLTVRHDELRLIGQRVLEGDEEDPVAVRLEPWGTASGRIIDAEGLPRAGLSLSGADELGRVEIGSDGRFHLEGLVPGKVYRFHVLEDGNFHIGRLDHEILVRPGETVDLGDVLVVATEPGG